MNKICGGASNCSNYNVCWCEYYLIRFDVGQSYFYSLKCGVKSTNYSDASNAVVLSELTSTLNKIKNDVKVTILDHKVIGIDDLAYDINTEYSGKTYNVFGNKYKSIRVKRKLFNESMYTKDTFAKKMLINIKKEILDKSAKFKNDNPTLYMNKKYDINNTKYDEMTDLEIYLNNNGDAKDFRFDMNSDWYITLNKDNMDAIINMQSNFVSKIKKDNITKRNNCLTSVFEFFSHYWINKYFIKSFECNDELAWCRVGRSKVSEFSTITSDNTWKLFLNSAKQQYGIDNMDSIGKYELFVFKFSDIHDVTNLQSQNMKIIDYLERLKSTIKYIDINTILKYITFLNNEYNYLQPYTNVIYNDIEQYIDKTTKQLNISNIQLTKSEKDRIENMVEDEIRNKIEDEINKQRIHHIENRQRRYYMIKEIENKIRNTKDDIKNKLENETKIRKIKEKIKKQIKEQIKNVYDNEARRFYNEIFNQFETGFITFLNNFTIKKASALTDEELYHSIFNDLNASEISDEVLVRILKKMFSNDFNDAETSEKILRSMLNKYKIQQLDYILTFINSDTVSDDFKKIHSISYPENKNYIGIIQKVINTLKDEKQKIIDKKKKPFDDYRASEKDVYISKTGDIEYYMTTCQTNETVSSVVALDDACAFKSTNVNMIKYWDDVLINKSGIKYRFFYYNILNNTTRRSNIYTIR